MYIISLINKKRNPMKKLIFFLALTVFIFTASIAQQSNYRFPKSNQIFENSATLEANLQLPSPKAVVWNWDTIVAFDTLNNLMRLTRTYNSNGYANIGIKQLAQGTAWVNSQRILYLYDANWNLDTLLTQTWISSTSTWYNSEEHTYTFDGNGRILTDIWAIYASGTWSMHTKNTYTYNSSGKVLTNTHENYTGTTWLPGSRDTYTYDVNGNVLTNVHENGSTGSYVNQTQNTYTYNGNQMATEILANWTSGAWVPQFKNTYTYTGGNLTNELWQTYSNPNWANDYNIDRTYDANGNLLSQTEQIWQGSWTNSAKYTRTLDVSGNLLNVIMQNWQVSAWVNTNKYSYTYDVSGNSVTGKYETWPISSWVLTLNSSLDLYASKKIIYTVSITNIARYTAHYVSFSTGIMENSEKVQFTLFPNPANNYITIKSNGSIMNSLKIFNINGQEVKNQLLNKTSNNVNVNLDNFANGMYFMQLQTEKGTITKKFEVSK